MTQLSHMTATAVLEHDHRSIETVAVTMSTIADRLEQGRRIDTALLTEVIFFLRIFADQCQDAKEEGLLFPALQAKCVSDSACPITTLQNEHRKAGSLTLELLDAADAYAAGHASAPKSLLRTLRALASLYREHIWKENHVLLPLAERVLSAEEQDSLYEAFQGVESKIGPDEVASRIGQCAQRCPCDMGEVLI